MIKKLGLSPSDLGIDNVNLKAAANTIYATPVIDVRRFGQFYMQWIVTVTGAATVGVFAIEAVIFERDGITILRTETLATGLSSSVTGTIQLVIRQGLAPLSAGLTIGALADLVKIPEYMKIQIKITTASDAATSATADMWLLMAR